MDFILLINPIAYILADSDEIAAVPLLLALSGFIFYAMIYSRYRNADKRHVHERETRTEVANLQCSDVFIQRRKGLRSASIKNSNHIRVEGAQNVSSGSSLTKLTKLVKP